MRIARGAGQSSSASDDVAVEEPLEIRAAGDTIAITMRTPGEDRELAVGFLFAEGLIESARDVGTLTHCGRVGDPARENTIDVRPAPGFAFDLDKLALSRRGTLSGSACGVCGRASIDDLLAQQGPVPAGAPIAASVLANSIATLQRLQPSHARTGGLHAAALLDAQGAALYAHEDIGRHNAVDKAIGAWLIAQVLSTQPAAPCVLVVSGRVSFEIVQKAARAGLFAVCGASAPSSLAIDVAEALGLALAAFVREDGFNLYTHPERVDLDA
jgi:FdhD protein